jgi:hypothetical protein
MTQENANPSEDLARIIESANRLGVEMDETEALQWLTAIASWKVDSDIAVDETSGVYGHKISMLDFSPTDLAYFRAIGSIVEFQDEPGVVETALALSGSAAQSKIQTFPGDCDYFERINIIAPTRAEACDILSRIMREKALSAFKGDTYRLIEVKFGSYPQPIKRGETIKKKGAPISWSADEVKSGNIIGTTPDGQPVTITWDQVKNEPGWCKLDWVVADPVRGRVSNASNMLDITWEAPDGSITPLDGYLDPYFQEIYLQAESIPLFSKLVKHVGVNALQDYVKQLEHEVQKYAGNDPRNYGKVAKRMYNIFRLTGRYGEAAFLRELFDEPATVLYQVWTLIETLNEAGEPGSTITMDTMLKQADTLILQVIKALEGPDELNIVQSLLRLRDSISRHDPSQMRSNDVQYAQTEVIKVVNDFFYQRLSGIPSIVDYMRDVLQEKPT